MKIRFATQEDMDQIIQLCKEHSEYEECEYDSTGKKEMLSQAIFAAQPGLFCMVGEQDKNLIGYITFMKQYSTWDACFYVYLDCLYLSEGSRSKGYGALFMDALKAYASKESCKVIQWQTPDFNTRAIKFYKRIGAESKSKERFFWAV